MRYYNLDHESKWIPLAKLALGTCYFGTQIDEKTAFSLMDRYVEAGGNIIDTARSYANWIPNGEGASEKVIGTWLEKSGMRKQVLVSTKGGLSKHGANPYRAALAPKQIRQELDRSRDALRVDKIDLYWLHRDDLSMPVGEIVDMADELVRNGAVNLIGVSNWAVDRLYEAELYAQKNGRQTFFMNQIQFSLGICDTMHWGDDTIVCMDNNMYQWYLEKKKPIFAYSSQAQGFFSTLIEKGVSFLSDDIRMKYYWGENLERAEQVRELSRRFQVPVSSVVLSYLLENSLDVIALIGCKNLEQLNDSLMALAVNINIGSQI